MSTLGGTAAALGLAPYLTVYTFDSDARQHAFSPFATKLFFRLRHGGVPYETALGTRQEAPKGKIPYVRFHRQPDWQERQREGGSKSATMAAVKEDVVGDSAIITSRLMKEGMLQDLNAELTHTGLAWDLSLRTLVEDRLYYLLVRFEAPYLLCCALFPFQTCCTIYTAGKYPRADPVTTRHTSAGSSTTRSCATVAHSRDSRRSYAV